MTDLFDDFTNRSQKHCDEYVEPGGSLTPEKLRIMADWFDTYDQLAEVFLDGIEKIGTRTEDEIEKAREVVRGDGVQDDLRRWADELENPPDSGTEVFTMSLYKMSAENDTAMFVTNEDGRNAEKAIFVTWDAWLELGRPVQINVGISVPSDA